MIVRDGSSLINTLERHHVQDFQELRSLDVQYPPGNIGAPAAWVHSIPIGTKSLHLPAPKIREHPLITLPTISVSQSMIFELRERVLTTIKYVNLRIVTEDEDRCFEDMDRSDELQVVSESSGSTSYTRA